MPDAKSGSGPDFPVVLTHGLWAPGVLMRPLARRLEGAGFRCHTFSYLGTARTLENHIERLVRFAHAIGPAHFVGHSLGGLVVMEALARHRDLAAGRVVLLGTSARGNFAGRRLARHAVGRRMLGASVPLWRERDSRWTRAESLGVIAGSRPFGLGVLLGRLEGPSDGVVTVEETSIEGMSERITLPVGHSEMLVSAKVAAQTAAFLADGKFLANIQ
jgi:pimeloyl-ACP methyl ester carboxylesterase